VNILGKWVLEGRFTTSDFEKLEDKKKLEELFIQGNFHVGIYTILQVIDICSDSNCIDLFICL
jgi:hypothetical protein